MGKFFKGFFLAVLVCLLIWACWWLIKICLDVFVSLIGAAAGLTWLVGGPIIVILIAAIIYGIYYARTR